MAKSLQGSKSHANLKDAFAGESQANRAATFILQGWRILRVIRMSEVYSETRLRPDRTCFRASRLSQRSWRSLHGHAHRQHGKNLNPL
jgi:hypothetical protein